MGCVLRGIDKVRDGYAAIVRRLLRVAVAGAGAGRRSAAPASRLSASVTPTGFLPEEDQGAFFIAVAVARRRLGRPHARGGGAGRGPDATDAAGRSTCCRSSASRCSTAAAQTNAAFIVARLKPFADRTAAAERRAGGDRAGVRRGAADPLGGGLPVQPAADHRPVDQRRLRIPVARTLEGQDPADDGQRDAGRWSPPPTRTRG